MEGRDYRTGKPLDNKDPRNWKDLLDTAKTWAGHDYERSKTYIGLMWHYAQTTEEWQGFWSDNDIRDRITIKPKHEVAPLPPTIWRFITDRELPGWLEAPMMKMRNIGLEFGHSVSRVWQETAKDLTYASYGVTHYTEILRQTSWRLAEHVKTANWNMMSAGLGRGEAAQLKEVYQAAANAHPEYHQIWDYVIDRNPQRTSTSYGSRHRWGSYFHYGPYEQFEVRANLRAAMTQGEYINMLALTWPMLLARRVGTWYTSVFRPVQESFMGAIGKWDTRESALKRWEHTPPRIMEALHTMLNPVSALTVTLLPSGNDCWKSGAL